MRKLTVYIKQQQKKSASAVNTETIGNLSTSARKIFLKIRDQFDDPNHPIIQIIGSFQKEFIKDTKQQFYKLFPEVNYNPTVKNSTVKVGNENIEFEEICEDRRWVAPVDDEKIDRASLHTDINGSFAFSTHGNMHISKPLPGNKPLALNDTRLLETEADEDQDKEEFAKE